ncbi:MAG: hypothetical protein A2148_06985 [Chloroflexi bacterium RBG_16_68_14]|nr:MAG: hypothetical protein A2148_06985 [Chloroflexi bacterium RBG_16_68_14]
MEGTETYRRWLQRATVYALSMTAAGGATGVAFAAAGAGVSALRPELSLPLAAALGAIALAYALHELEFLRLPVPGRDWQVPADWVRRGFYRSAVIFGGTIGFGVFTRVPFASLPVLLAWLFLSGNVLYGLLAGLVYGAMRAFPIYSGGSRREPGDMVEHVQRLMRLAPLQHQVAGLGLAALAAYLLAAPYLP